MVKRYTIDDDSADMFEDDSGAYVTFGDYELMERNATEALNMLEHCHNDRDAANAQLKNRDYRLRTILAHTSYQPSCPRELLTGLLASVARICTEENGK